MEFAAPTEDVMGAAYLVVSVRRVAADEDPMAAHSALGVLVGESSYETNLEGSTGATSLLLANGDYSLDIDLELPNVRLVRARTYRSWPSWAEEREFHSVVTLLFDLFEAALGTRGAAGSCAGRAIDGGWLLGPCDHLGVVLLDVLEVAGRLSAEGLEGSADLIELLGSHVLADELVAHGAVIPVWGMRPWLYRVVSPAPSPRFLPLGRKVGSSFEYRFSSARSRLSVVRGADLCRWNRVRDGSPPSISFSREPVEGVEVSVYSATGFEPMFPELEVAVLPTIVISPLAEAEEPCAAPIELDPFDVQSLAAEWVAQI